MLEYLIIMLVFTPPFILYALYRRLLKALGLAGVLGLAIGVPWDLISAGYFQTWYWNKYTLIGIVIGPLPLEDYLLMILVPMLVIGAALVFKIDLSCAFRSKKDKV